MKVAYGRYCGRSDIEQKRQYIKTIPYVVVKKYKMKKKCQFYKERHFDRIQLIKTTMLCYYIIFLLGNQIAGKE